MRISVCLIVKNEEEVIERCLKSVVGFADEIIVVDTGSSDQTKSIARKFPDKIYDFKWIDDFSAARNFAFSKAKCEYVFWLDADDVIMPEDGEKINGLKKKKRFACSGTLYSTASACTKETLSAEIAFSLFITAFS